MVKQCIYNRAAVVIGCQHQCGPISLNIRRNGCCVKQQYVCASMCYSESRLQNRRNTTKRSITDLQQTTAAVSPSTLTTPRTSALAPCLSSAWTTPKCPFRALSSNALVFPYSMTIKAPIWANTLSLAFENDEQKRHTTRLFNDRDGLAVMAASTLATSPITHALKSSDSDSLIVRLAISMSRTHHHHTHRLMIRRDWSPAHCTTHKHNIDQSNVVE